MFLEDAGFDWKVLGPDVSDLDYVAWQCDQDAYACSGQKCSAQSMMFAHRCARAYEMGRGTCLYVCWTRGRAFMSGLCHFLKHFPHPLHSNSNWVKAGLLDKLKARAGSRNLSDLTIGPVLTWTTKAILDHTRRLLAIPGD